MSAKNPIRLPPLRVLRVRNPNQKTANPCVAVMTSVLSCWASSGYNAAGCQAVEQALRNCMDGPPAPAPKRNPVNSNLARMAKQISGPRKQKGSKC